MYVSILIVILKRLATDMMINTWNIIKSVWLKFYDETSVIFQAHSDFKVKFPIKSTISTCRRVAKVA